MIPRLFRHREECYRYTRDAEDFFLWWGERDLNPRPVACKATALTAELPPLSLKILTSFPNTELRDSRPHSGPAVAEGVRIFGFSSLAVSVAVDSPVGDSYLDRQRISFALSMYVPLCWEKKSNGGADGTRTRFLLIDSQVSRPLRLQPREKLSTSELSRNPSCDDGNSNTALLLCQAPIWISFSTA